MADSIDWQNLADKPLSKVFMDIKSMTIDSISPIHTEILSNLLISKSDKIIDCINTILSSKPLITSNLILSLYSKGFNFNIEINLNRYFYPNNGNPFVWFFIRNPTLLPIELLESFITCIDVYKLFDNRQILHLLLKNTDTYSLSDSILDNFYKKLDYDKFTIDTIAFYIYKQYKLPNLKNITQPLWLKFLCRYENEKIITNGIDIYYSVDNLYMAKLVDDNLSTYIFDDFSVVCFKHVEDYIKMPKTTNYNHQLLSIIKTTFIKIHQLDNLDIKNTIPTKCLELTKNILKLHPRRVEIKLVIEYYISKIGFKAMHEFLKEIPKVEKDLSKVYRYSEKDTDDEDNFSIVKYINVLNNIIFEIGNQLNKSIDCNSSIKLFRGISYSLTKLDMPLSIGSIINNHRNQFVSFSRNYDTAAIFSNNFIILVLHLDMTNDIFLPIETYNLGEKEWLLPINTSFIVIDKPFIYNGIIHINISIYKQEHIEITGPLPPSILENNVLNVVSLL